MINNYNDDYQYDSCISRGICSTNPRTSSLQEVLVLYLKLSSHYAFKLYEHGVLDEKILDKVNPTINSNVKFSTDNFVKISIADGERDIIYESGSNIYKLSTIDNCTKNKECSWGE